MRIEFKQDNSGNIKINQAIGNLKLSSKDCKISVNPNGKQENNLLLRRIIENAIEDNNLLPKGMDEIVVRVKHEGKKFEVMVGDASKLGISKTYSEDDMSNKLQQQFLPFAHEAYKMYNPKLPSVIQRMEKIFGNYGTIQARAKNPISGSNRLLRTATSTWGPPNGISSGKDALENIWDAIGSRVVLKTGSKIEIQGVVDSMAKAIIDGELEIRSLNNLRGPKGIPYFTDDQIKQLKQASSEHEQNQSSLNIKQATTQFGNAERTEGSPFTCVCVYIKHGDDVTGELQIIGPQVLKLANAEHLPYDALINKDLYRELDTAGKDKMKPHFEPFLQAIKSLDSNSRVEYNNYLNACYIHARNVEKGIEKEEDVVELPKSLEQFSELSIEHILKIENEYEKVKKSHKT